MTGSEELGRGGPLGHVRVLDLSRALAGPWAGQLLGDLGAEVIKVERVGTGDDTREWGPPWLLDTAGNATRESAYYLGVNRGKRSITLDLQHPGGRQVVLDLAATSDVVLENFRVGALDRLGLGYEDLRAVRADIVYCSITGFGQDGPRRDEAAYDFAVQALGGLMSVTGQRDGEPGAGPQKVGIPIIDLSSGTFAALAVLAALLERDRTGRGAHLDLAMLDVEVAMLSNQAMNYLVSGNRPRRSGNAHPNIQPQDVYPCSDGLLAVAVGNDAQFVRLCAALGNASLASDERFSTNGARVQNLPDLRAALVDRFATDTRQAWATKLESAGVPCGPINSIDEVFAEAQVVHRGMRADVPHPLAGTVPLVRSPLRFDSVPGDRVLAPPTLGQHTEEILRSLGRSDDDIEQLRRDATI